MVKKTHFITGKGGVGKSLISLYLAHNFSSFGQKILLAELSEYSFYKNYLNLPNLAYEPIKYNEKFDVCQLSPKQCLKEYCLHLLKVESLYKLFFENSVSKSLIEVAPGLQELALLGKITSSPRGHGPSMNYDTIVVDAPSTGHFLSLLRGPAAMGEAISFGPMGEQSRSIDKLIKDPNFTKIHIVSLAEELPITETLELYHQIKTEFNLTPKVYLNKILNFDLNDLKGLSDEALEIVKHKMSEEQKAKNKLTAASVIFTELPFVFSLKVDELITELSSKVKTLDD